MRQPNDADILCMLKMHWNKKWFYFVLIPIQLCIAKHQKLCLRFKDSYIYVNTGQQVGDNVRAIASFCDSIAMRRVAVISGQSENDIDFTRLLARLLGIPSLLDLNSFSICEFQKIFMFLNWVFQTKFLHNFLIFFHFIFFTVNGP